MLTEWLMQNASPVIRYRTLVEIIKSTDEKLIQRTKEEVLALPQTQKRLANAANLDFARIHGANDTYLENVLPMLEDFGLTIGDVKGLRIPKNIPDNFPDAQFLDKLIAYPFLLRAGFPYSELLDYAQERIDTIYDFTRHGNYAIYDADENHPRLPKAFRTRPVIKPEIASAEAIRLPLIYDMVLLAAAYRHLPPATQAKIDNIVDYVLDNQYDWLKTGYGILNRSPGKYYSMGWDCIKPFNSNRYYGNQNMTRLLLYAQFPTAVKSKWFSHAVDYFAQFRTGDDTYIFTKGFMGEKNSNWVLGAHNSLGENRRKKNWMEVESTFYMCKLLANMRDTTGGEYVRLFPPDIAYQTLFGKDYAFDPVDIG